MTSLLRPALIGAVAGLRTVTAPAAVSLAARTGALDLRESRLFFLGEPISPWIFGALAAGELVTDQLPGTPSRLSAGQFGARLASGALCGTALNFPGKAPWRGMLAGVAGAALGTLAGHAIRARLARRLGSDRPAALIEDAVAIAAALAVVRRP